MNGAASAVHLWLAFAWPLLLAFPALHARLPWPRQLAILPAVLLVVLAGDVSQQLPLSVSGMALVLDDGRRWLLAMSVVVWLVAAKFRMPARHAQVGGWATTCFMLTLAGNLGAVLVNELVGFFSFSTLMGYGLYGLLIQDGGVAARRAGRCYLLSLIAADLLLFDALLLAAHATADLRFEALREVMAVSGVAPIYPWLVVVGFALRAGIWPAHLWLTAACGSAPPMAVVLLGGAPVAMGLLGMWRWAGPGVGAAPLLGEVLQVLGAAALLYTLLRGGMLSGAKTWRIGWGSALIALCVAALGTGLGRPQLGAEYGHLASPAIAVLGVLWALAWSVAGQSERPAEGPGRLASPLSWLKTGAGAWLERLRAAALSWARACCGDGRGAWLMQRGARMLASTEGGLQRWPLAITLLLGLALGLALSALDL